MQLLHEIYAIWEIFHLYAIWELCHLRQKRFFFQKFASGAENLAKTRTKPCLGRAKKINSVDLKKGRQSF